MLDNEDFGAWCGEKPQITMSCEPHQHDNNDKNIIILIIYMRSCFESSRHQLIALLWKDAAMDWWQRSNSPTSRIGRTNKRARQDRNSAFSSKKFFAFSPGPRTISPEREATTPRERLTAVGNRAAL